MNTMQVQLAYVMNSGRVYNTMPFTVSEGTELQDLHGKVKYQLTMDSYPIEFTNDRGDAQVIMARNVETILVKVLGTVAPIEQPVYEETLQEFAEPVADASPTGFPLRSDKTYNIPVPTQHVHVSDSEKTQEIYVVPLADALASKEPAAGEPREGAYAPRSRANSGGMGKGTDPR